MKKFRLEKIEILPEKSAILYTMNLKAKLILHMRRKNCSMPVSNRVTQSVSAIPWTNFLAMGS